MTAEVPAELAQPPAWTRPRWGRREATARRADFGLIRRGLAGYTERGGFRTDRSHSDPSAASPRLSSSRTAAALLGIRLLKRKSSTVAGRELPPFFSAAAL